MLEKPDLADAEIRDCLRTAYAIDARAVEFLPLGNESNTWVYRVQTNSGESYFLKVKKGRVYPPTLSVPHFLQKLGIGQVVAPLPTRSGRLWRRLGNYALILYPFIAGQTGMEAGLTASQWAEFGRVLRQIHAVKLSPDLARQVRAEDFVPAWGDTAHQLARLIEVDDFQHPIEEELGRFWKSRSAEIHSIVERTEALGRMLQATTRPDSFGLRHSDIHTANLLVDPGGELHIVDWDQPRLAPIERDLMFFVGTAGDGLSPANQEQAWFFSGYGRTEINPLALAYYKYEWVVQEIGDDGARIFLSPQLGEESKKAALADFQGLFAPGDVVEGAYRAEKEL